MTESRIGKDQRRKEGKERVKQGLTTGQTNAGFLISMATRGLIWPLGLSSAMIKDDMHHFLFYKGLVRTVQ